MSKVTTDFYQVICEDYEEEQAMGYAAKRRNCLSPKRFACSAMRNGNYLGYNYDSSNRHMADILIHVPRGHRHYASVGVAGGLPEFTPETRKRGFPHGFCDFLPYATWDGINECGVVCCAGGVWCTDLRQQTADSGEGKKILPVSFVVRIVLDHAASAKQALEMLQNREICKQVSRCSGEEDWHFMIADAKNTFIVEWIDGRMMYRSDETVMTNFSLIGPPTAHAAGMERYRLLKKNYFLGNSGIESMASLMQSVRFANDPKDRGCAAGQIRTIHSNMYDLPRRRVRIYVRDNYQQCFEFSMQTNLYTVRSMI